MSIDIGRTVGLEVAGGSDFDGTLSGLILADSHDAARVAVQQILALTPGEVVPVVDHDHPHRSGMYEVGAAVAGLRRPTNTARSGTWDVVLRRIARPRVEVSYRFSDRTTAAAAGTAPTNVYPVAPFATPDGEGDVWATDRSAAFGTLTQMDVADPAGQQNVKLDVGSLTYSDGLRTDVVGGLDPRWFYHGAVLVEFKPPDSGEWWPLVGQHVPEDADVRISNGRIECTVVFGAGYLLWRAWTGTAWSLLARTTLSSTAVSVAAVRRPQVPVNRPDRCVLSVPFRLLPESTYGTAAMMVDIVVLRGVESARVMVSRLDGAAHEARLALAEWDGSDMATASATQQLDRSSANSNGVTASIWHDGTPTKSTSTDDVRYAASAQPRVFGVGPDVTGALDRWRTEYLSSQRVF